MNQNNQHWEESPRGVNCWAVVDHRRHLSSLGPWSLRLFPRLELRLAPRERKVSESDHVLDLSLHSDAEEGDEVHD